MVFPSEQNTMWDVGPESLISISADCSLSEGRGAWTVEEDIWLVLVEGGRQEQDRR